MVRLVLLHREPRKSFYSPPRGVLRPYGVFRPTDRKGTRQFRSNSAVLSRPCGTACPSLSPRSHPVPGSGSTCVDSVIALREGSSVRAAVAANLRDLDSAGPRLACSIFRDLRQRAGLKE